jgi:glycosyltransferase involved in cell wall biosynthesis
MRPPPPLEFAPTRGIGIPRRSRADAKHLPRILQPSETDAPVLSILMPVFNEASTIARAIASTLATDVGVPFELIVIDDGSTDGTSELLATLDRDARITLLAHERNRGKGAAVRTGLAAARGQFSAILDADLEYEPADLAVLLTPLRAERANVAFGVRAFDGYTSHSFAYVIGNKAVTLIANMLFNAYIRDLMTCHKMMRTDLFRSLPLREPGFAIEAEIVARLLQRGERPYEVPISYRARASDEGKKLTWVDGFRVLRTLARCRLSGA